MPVRYDGRSKKWCVGSRCVYDTKEDAERSYKGYLGQKFADKIMKKIVKEFGRKHKHTWNTYDPEKADKRKKDREEKIADELGKRKEAERWANLTNDKDFIDEK